MTTITDETREQVAVQCNFDGNKLIQSTMNAFTFAIYETKFSYSRKNVWYSNKWFQKTESFENVA